MLRAAMNDTPGLNVQKSSFTAKAFDLAMPRLDLFDSLTTREILLAIPSEKLVRLSVLSLTCVVRAAKRDKCFNYLLMAVGKDIGPAYAKLLLEIIPKTNKAFGRAPVTRLLFLARLAVAYQFECDKVSIKQKGPNRIVLDQELVAAVRAAIDQVHAAVTKEKIK